MMSVRMAIAQLCACACGGAAIGGGAVHYVNHHPRVTHVKRSVAPARRIPLPTCAAPPAASAAAVRSVLSVPIQPKG